MPATERDVVELARWLHDVRLDLDGYDPRGEWERIGPREQKFWHGLARALLDYPPDVVRRAVRRQEIKD